MLLKRGSSLAASQGRLNSAPGVPYSHAAPRSTPRQGYGAYRHKQALGLQAVQTAAAAVSDTLSLVPSTAGGYGLASADDSSAGGTVAVKFHLRYKTSWGQGVKIIGSHAKLGNWTLKGALELKWREGDVWVGTAPVPSTIGILEYKYVIIDFHSKAATAWQAGGNSVLAIKPDEQVVEVHDNWGNDPGAVVNTESGNSTRELKLQAWAGEMLAYRQEARLARMDVQHRSDEVSQLRAEVLRLKAELHQAQANAMQASMHIADLQQSNVVLNTQLEAMQIEMMATIQEAMKLIRMTEGDQDEEAEEEEAEAADEGAAAAASVDTPDNGHRSFASASGGSMDQGGLDAIQPAVMEAAATLSRAAAVSSTSVDELPRRSNGGSAAAASAPHTPGEDGQGGGLPAPRSEPPASCPLVTVASAPQQQPPPPSSRGPRGTPANSGAGGRSNGSKSRR